MTTGPYTVFAPNNNAFEKLMDELQITLEDIIMLPNLRDILWYHLVGGYLLTDQLMSKELRTLHDNQGLYIDTDKHKDKYSHSDYNQYNDNGFAASGIYLQDEQHDMSSMIIKNVQARNGVVHVVNRVLMLRWESITQVVASLADLSILHTSLIYANLIPYLSLHGPFTAFAPSNAAFRKLALDLHVTIEQIWAMPILPRILMYHITPGYFVSHDLYSQPYMTEIGQLRHIVLDNYYPTQGFRTDGIKHIDQQDDIASVLVGNVETKNGVAYITNRVLVNMFHSIFEVGVQFADYSIVMTLYTQRGFQPMQSDPMNTLTIFAPNNMAFFVLMDELLMDFDDLFNLPNMGDILANHMLPVKIMSCDLPPTMISLHGQPLHFIHDLPDDCYGYTIPGLTIIDGQQDPCNVLFGNVQTYNGPVHVIQRILMPLLDSVFQVATLLKDYSIVTELLISRGLDELFVSPGHFTIFAPRNDAFYYLMDELRITMEDIFNMPLLREILLYHATEAYLLSYDLLPSSYLMMNDIMAPQYTHIKGGHGYGTGFYGFA
eukprot:258344_1